MSEQPEALRWAEWLEHHLNHYSTRHENFIQAAAELRRLYEENSALAAGQCTEGGPWGDEGGTPYCKLKELNRELLEALDTMLTYTADLNPMQGYDIEYDHDAVIQARAALAKAKGETG